MPRRIPKRQSLELIYLLFNCKFLLDDVEAEWDYPKHFSLTLHTRHLEPGWDEAGGGDKAGGREKTGKAPSGRDKTPKEGAGS